MGLAKMTICVLVLTRIRSTQQIGSASVRRVAMSILQQQLQSVEVGVRMDMQCTHL